MLWEIRSPQLQQTSPSWSLTASRWSIDVSIEWANCIAETVSNLRLPLQKVYTVVSSWVYWKSGSNFLEYFLEHFFEYTEFQFRTWNNFWRGTFGFWFWDLDFVFPTWQFELQAVKNFAVSNLKNAVSMSLIFHEWDKRESSLQAILDHLSRGVRDSGELDCAAEIWAVSSRESWRL